MLQCKRLNNIIFARETKLNTILLYVHNNQHTLISLIACATIRKHINNMNIGHHRKRNVGQAHCRAGVHNNDYDGYNKVEARNDADELEMGNGGMGEKDKENRERGTNNNGKAFGSGKHTPHRANTKIQLRVSGGMWAIIVVAVVCMIPIWLHLYSLIWTGGRDVISIEEKMLSPHLVHVQRPLAIIDPHKTDVEGSELPSDTVAAASNVSEGIKSSLALVASNDERELKAPSVVRGHKDDSNSASNITMIVFTLSKPSGRDARDKQRSFCRPLYESHGIKHVFSVGKPSLTPDHVIPMYRENSPQRKRSACPGI